MFLVSGKAHERTAAIDEQSVPPRRDHEDGVALADVEDRHFEVARRPFRAKREECDEGRTCEQGGAERPLRRPEASWGALQADERFDMKSLREKIEEMHFRDLVAHGVFGVCVCSLRRPGKHRQVPR
jgi:hypothetical protein